MNTPKITILMPAYNAEKYIGEAIRSVLVQTFSDFEFLIVNDGSNDGTQQVIDSFSDERIVQVTQVHSGVSKTLNNGLSMARGEYIARFDADDICFPDRLEKQHAFLESHPEYVMVGSDAEYILENGEHLFDFACIAHSHEAIMDKLYFYCPFIHSSVMYRKEAVITAGGYSLPAHNFEDYLLWTQLSKIGELYNLPEILIRVRFNPASVTIDEKWRGQRFRELKRKAIRRGYVTKEEGDELQAILQKQDMKHVKEGAYYALCAKKFLTDNYQPKESRMYARKAIHAMPFRLDNYALLLAGFLPEKFIQWLHKRSPNKL
jgi:glycosyltransferase involved in cell wall biosynthesis